MTLEEYNRRWALIMQAFADGYFTQQEASDAIRELTRQRTARK
jgi:hypothetical protein